MPTARRSLRGKPLRSRAETWNGLLSTCLLKTAGEQLVAHQKYLREASDTEVRWLVSQYGDAFTRAHVLTALGGIYLRMEHYHAAETAFRRLLRDQGSPYPQSQLLYLAFLAREGRRHLWLWQMSDPDLKDVRAKLERLIGLASSDDWVLHLQYKVAICSFRLAEHSRFFRLVEPILEEKQEATQAFMEHAPRFRESCYLLMICAKLESGRTTDAEHWLERIRACAPSSEYYRTGSRLLDTWGR